VFKVLYSETVFLDLCGLFCVLNSAIFGAQRLLLLAREVHIPNVNNLFLNYLLHKPWTELFVRNI
jgi:hypothetical protein